MPNKQINRRSFLTAGLKAIGISALTLALPSCTEPKNPKLEKILADSQPYTSPNSEPKESSEYKPLQEKQEYEELKDVNIFKFYNMLGSNGISIPSDKTKTKAFEEYWHSLQPEQRVMIYNTYVHSNSRYKNLNTWQGVSAKVDKVLTDPSEEKHKQEYFQTFFWMTPKQFKENSKLKNGNSLFLFTKDFKDHFYSDDVKL